MIGLPDPSQDLKNYGQLLIRRAVLREDWIAAAICDIRAAEKKQWDLQEWDTALRELKASTLTVNEWLTLYT